MIRKVILFLIIAFITLWFFGAHLVKNKLVSIMHELESDNIKISYQDTKISGFPFYWQVTFLAPKLSIIDQKSVKEISGVAMDVKTDYLTQNIAVNMGKVIICGDVGIRESRPVYNFTSNKDMRMDIFFQRPIYFLESSSAWKNIESMTRFELGTIGVSAEGEKIFSLTDIQAVSKAKQYSSINSINIRLTGDYHSEQTIAKLKKAHLFLDLSYLINDPLLHNDEKIDFDHKIEVSKLHLKLDDASLGLQGDVKLNRSSLPRGEFDVSLGRYQEVVDKIVPDNFIISQSYIKQVISKSNNAVAGVDMQNANFKVFFSNKGLSVGKAGVVDLKKSDNAG